MDSLRFHMDSSDQLIIHSPGAYLLNDKDVRAVIKYPRGKKIKWNLWHIGKLPQHL